MSDGSIRKVAVVGCGTMGIGIAIVAARGGCETLLHDTEETRIAKAREDAAAFLARSVKLERLSQQEADAALARLVPAPHFDALASCDLVIEAVFEDQRTKELLIQRLDSLCPVSTVLASNTSTLSITRIAAASRHPDRVIGLHFCLPAQLMKLVEVTPGLNTAPAAFERAWQFCLAVGQIPVETQDSPGFVLNHFVIPLNNRAIRMVEDKVASAVDIDKAVKAAYGHAMGPLELVDLVGVDTQERLCDAFYPITLDPELACPNIVRQMVAAGWLGRKSGRGFYRYNDKQAFGA
ncbi:3-hydroxyacyl-CoA dehydrogenase family protein [Bradyrhizobium tropiciagri]|uniref:3-hydroxyacyl-CoA dehydrogenase family protein n=1 Tax=Bradyrhizobium tropiciagri TaxID=312253 RepID=UPI00067BCB04|nr:3-hydroxyacyl-CoA dehydrogenase family protein [Bradyrhizobium tropiciagri]